MCEKVRFLLIRSHLNIPWSVKYIASIDSSSHAMINVMNISAVMIHTYAKACMHGLGSKTNYTATHWSMQMRFSKILYMQLTTLLTYNYSYTLSDNDVNVYSYCAWSI